MSIVQDGDKGAVGADSGVLDNSGDLITAEALGGLAASVGDLVAQELGGESLSFDSGDVDDQMVLSLDELLPDTRGEVVLFSEAGPMAINITTDERIMETGMADHHVTSTGLDVSGYSFYTFEDGLTVYYPPEIDLLITAHTG